MALVALLASPALAQAPLVHHPAVPSAGAAAEDGPGALWVNPANLAYDPDLRFGAFVDGTSDRSRIDWGATIGTGAFDGFNPSTRKSGAGFQRPHHNFISRCTVGDKDHTSFRRTSNSISA